MCSQSCSLEVDGWMLRESHTVGNPPSSPPDIFCGSDASTPAPTRSRKALDRLKVTITSLMPALFVALVSVLYLLLCLRLASIILVCAAAS